MKSIDFIQREVGEWAKSQFGDNVSQDVGHPSYQKPIGSLAPLMGVMEELGELCRVMCRRAQGRGYDDSAEAYEAKVDAVGDLLVFLSDFCFREGIDLQEALDKTWAKVCHRRQATWATDKAKEGAPPAKTKKPKRRTVAEVLEARSHGPMGGCCERYADNKACDCLTEATRNVIQDGHGFGHVEF